MTLTISNATGGGQIAASIQLPDSGHSVVVTGTIGGVALTGSPVTIPTPPAEGLIYYIIQANKTTGALTVVEGTEEMPSAAAGNVSIFSQVLATTNSNAALNATSATPDV